MSEIKAVLFDLDGTLVHSEEVAARTVESVFRRHGVVLEARYSQLVTGKTWDSAMNDLEKWVRLPVARSVLLNEIMSEYRVRLKTEVFPVPGGVRAVQSLSKKFRLALVSGSYREEIFFALKSLNIKENFEVILGAEDYSQSKPAPDGYLMALNQMNVSPHQALVFEDSEPGIQSAINAGCKVVHVRYCQSAPFGSPWVLKANASVEDFEEVHPEWVFAQFPFNSETD